MVVLPTRPRSGARAGAAATVALARLTAALVEEARLHPAGLRAAASAITSALATLRAVTTVEARVAGVPVPGPLVITGLHRTGTSLLQELLAEHPGLRVPRLWELMFPVGAGSFAERARSYVDEYHRAAPGFRAIHRLDPDRPEECHRLTAPTFLSEIYALRYRVPGYLAWLDTQDHTPAYRFHRAALRAILHRSADQARTVVLKCPFHLWHTDTLAAVYPHARIVRLHRDPVTALVSGCSLVATIRRARSHAVDPAEIGAFWLDRTTTAVERMLTSGVAGLPVLDVRQDELGRDPIGVASRVCDFAGVPATSQALQRMRGYLAGAGGVGAHRYRPEDYGLDPDRLAGRFAAYRARFGV